MDPLNICFLLVVDWKLACSQRYYSKTPISDPVWVVVGFALIRLFQPIAKTLVESKKPFIH